MTYYAKSPQRDGTQETVREHTQKVKVLAQTYGKSFGEEISAGLCGVFHDFGKYSSAFQQVLQGTRTGVDHAIAGAVFLYGLRKKALHPIIEVVAAHHSHLISCDDLSGVMETALETEGPIMTLCGKQAALCGGKRLSGSEDGVSVGFPGLSFSKVTNNFASTTFQRTGGFNAAYSDAVFLLGRR